MTKLKTRQVSWKCDTSDVAHISIHLQSRNHTEKYAYLAKTEAVIPSVIPHS